MIKIGINGFGRIGKCLLLQLLDNPQFQICALNATNISPKHIEDYLKYDSVHKMTAATTNPYFKVEIINDQEIQIGRHKIRLFSDRKAANLSWKQYGCEYLFDATGSYLTTAKCQEHAVKYIVMSAPAKDATPTYIVGANEERYCGEQIVSASSCTTNGLAPILRILDDAFTINHCSFTTIHATTASQVAVDVLSNSSRTSRSILGNIIPHTTGASASVISVLPNLQGKIAGTSVRVPVANCSLLDINLEFDSPFMTLNQIENILLNHPLYNIVFRVVDKNLVSSDFCTTTTPTILDLNASILMGPRKFKLMVWYDNEWSYSAQMIRLVQHMFSFNNTVKPRYYLENLDMTDKGVVVRLDFNVPTSTSSNGTSKTIIDDFRIRSAIPTIKTILSKMPKYVILASHFGRPSKKDEENSMQFMVPVLRDLLGKHVRFLEDGINKNTLDTIKTTLENSQEQTVVFLLENLRFHSDETEYDEIMEFDSETIKIYRQLGDVFISDAFGCVHRNHMSICDMKYSSKMYGYGHLIKKEMDALNLLVNNGQDNRKILGIIGGNKIKDKMPLINSIRQISNSQLFITGGIAKQYYLLEQSTNGQGKNNSQTGQNNVVIMNDGFGNISLDKPLEYVSTIESIFNFYDIGSKSLTKLKEMIDQSDIIFWNGSLGVIEHEEYSRGSKQVVEYLEMFKNKLVIIGGGETASLFQNNNKSENKHIYVSTGGGALLEYLQNKVLYGKLVPGLDIFC